MKLKRMFGRRTLKVCAKMPDEVGEIDKSNLAATPEMIVNLRDRRNAHGGVLQCMLDVPGLGASSLHAQQTNDRSQAVFHAMTHLTREQICMIKSFLKLRVSMLTLNRDSQQAGKTCQKIRVGIIELPGIGTVSFENAEGRVALATPSDEHIDCPLDAMFGQKLRRAKTRFLLQVI